MKTASSHPTVSSLLTRFLLLLAAALAGLASNARAETLLDEQFADGDRTAQRLPASAHWFLDASGGAYASTVADHTWSILPPDPPSHLSAISYFTGGAPVSLQPGESLVLSFTVRPTNSSALFGFGLFNSGGARLVADTTGGGSALNRIQGYGVTTQAGAKTSLSRRATPGQGLWNPATFASLATSPAPLASAPSYTATLTVARDAEGLVTVTSDVGGTQTTSTDENGLSSFDTVAILLDGQMKMASLGNVTVIRNTAAPADGHSQALAQNSSTDTTAPAASSTPHKLSTLSAGSTWYLQATQTPTTEDWNTLADWFSATSGGGSNPASIAATDTFNLNGFLGHTPQIATGTTTFGGGLLDMGTTGTLSVLGANLTTTVVPNLLANNGVIKNTGGTTQNIVLTNFSHPAGSITFQTGASTRTIALTSGSLTGAGALVFGGGGSYSLTINDAYNFTGPMTASTGTFTFQNNMVTSGSLIIAETSRINLTKAIACASLTLTGTTIVPDPGNKANTYTYPPGTYSYATLHAAYPAIFVSGSTTGSITVRSGTTYYLKVSQALGHDWSNAYLSDWNTKADGTGTVIPAIDPVDDYSTNGKLLRTPVAGGTFAGRTLLLDSGTIGLKNIEPALVTVPNLVATNGMIIQYLNTSGTASIRVNYFTQNTGTTTLFATSNQTLDLGIDYLSGSGNFRFTTAGASQFSVTDASQFTGTYTQVSGTLVLSPITSGPLYAIGSPFAMKGHLVVNTGATVVLNRDTYVGGLTVNGIVQPNGTYAAAILGFSGTAKIVVNTPDLAGPPQMFGVNLPGGTFAAGGALLPTNAANWDYYQAKGLTLVRVAFHWNDVQTTLSGTLNASVVSKLDTILSLANARGMHVIFDMHNYGQYTVSGTGRNIGSSYVSYADYQDVWDKLSAHFAANPNKAALYAYDIMNEPVNLGSDWLNAAKYAIAGVRAHDMSTYIIAEGKVWAGAQSWPSQNDDLGFIDPACRLIYSAHSYWGKNHNDTYLTYDGAGGDGAYPNTGVDQLSLFVKWIQKRKFSGFIGEYGVPTNSSTPDLRWNTVLENSLIYMRANGVSGTYWSGGAGWPATYALLCDTGTPPVDANPMLVLKLYHQ